MRAWNALECRVDSLGFQALLRIVERSNHTGYPTPYPALAAWDPIGDDAVVRAAWKELPASGGNFGLYIHIPFCPRRCSFCFLPVWAVGRGRGRAAGYLDALELEAGMYGSLLGGARFRSIYIGGGTPSVLDIAEIDRLFACLGRHFRRTAGCQVAMEVNPESFDFRKACRLRDLGVGWLTFGAQTLDDELLKRIGRTHAGGQVLAAYRAARGAGIPGVNIDLLYGLPGQSPGGFLEDVRRVAELRPDQVHLNVYVNAPKTALAKAGNKVSRAQFQAALGVQEQGFRILEKSGYLRLDADSAGLTSDSVNWQGTRAMAEGDSILGLGVVAVSYVRGVFRYVNKKDLGAYVRAVRAGRLPVERGVPLTPRKEMIHFALNSLEHKGELSRSSFMRTFHLPIEREFGAEIEALKAKGVLREGEGAYVLTDHPGGVFEYSRQFYEPAIIQKIASRYRMRTVKG
jgi:oxygen-independent coproporphyrinogen III oxidase